MLHRLHRASAAVISIFVLIHLVNQCFIIVGVDKHIEIMDLLRQVYRHLIVEAFLVLCLFYQVGSGFYFVFKRWREREGFIEKFQAYSGLYLAFFLLNHIGAVFYGRLVAGLDTNIYYGIAGYHVDPFQAFFIPYYFLAVVAFFTHIASAFFWLTRHKIAEKGRVHIYIGILAVGISLATYLTLGFSGLYNEVMIPSEYLKTYQ